MASHRFSLATLGDCSPCYRVALIADRVRYQMYRLDEGKAGIIQLLRPVLNRPLDPNDPERNYLSVELLYEFRLSKAQPLAELETNDTGLSVILWSTVSFYVALFGARGTAVSGRLETN